MKELIVGMSLMGLLMFGCYRLGVWAERRAYTGSFIKQVEAAYYDGFGDCKASYQLLK